MNCLWRILLLSCGLAGLGGCPTTYTLRNPFLSYTEEYGVAGASERQQADTSGQGAAGTETFRRSLTINLRNNHPDAELNSSLVCWVSVSSVRTAEQQDALLRDGYVQLTQEVRLGSAIVLPVGTYVYNGGGTAGAMTVFLDRAQALQTGQQQQGQTQTAGQDTTTQTVTATTTSVTLPTPDGILIFVQPPVSCDSVAFYYTLNGIPLPARPVAGSEGPYEGSSGAGPYKTLAQVDIYQCSPLRPGAYLSQGGAARQKNEYIEGEDVTFDFLPEPDANDDFCTVAFGAAAAEQQTTTTTTTTNQTQQTVTGGTGGAGGDTGGGAPYTP